MVAALQEEKERLQASHAQHLERLRLGFERQKQQLQLEHSRKVRVEDPSSSVQHQLTPPVSDVGGAATRRAARAES